MTNFATHYLPEWTSIWWGKWARDDRGLDPDGPPFEIEMSEVRVFSCRTAAWPGFNPAFVGYGGEEGYIHEKARQAGGRALCLPFLRWVHRFVRPAGVPYARSPEESLRNNLIGHLELGLDTGPMVGHFAAEMPRDRVIDITAQTVAQELGIRTAPVPRAISGGITPVPELGFTPVVASDPPPPKRYRLAIATVFLPREHLFFIEEWLAYHIAQGVEHVYLYNNAGSRQLDNGQNLEVTGLNKHGEPVYQLLADHDDDAVQRLLDEKLAPFVAAGYVTQIPWQPRDASGAIVYGQIEAALQHIRLHSFDAEWTAFTDLDEFLVSPRHGSITAAIDELDARGKSYIQMQQKCFASRFGPDGQPVEQVLEIVACHDGVMEIKLGGKSMVRSDRLTLPRQPAPHYIHVPDANVSREEWTIDAELLRFNHYKYNDVELRWAAGILGLPSVELDSEDDAMKRHVRRAQNITNSLKALHALRTGTP